MIKRYTFLSKNWLRFGLATAFAISFTLQLLAQVTPTKQWDKSFGGNELDQISTLLQTSDGGYIIGGSSNSGISGDKSEASRGYHDYWVVKTDAQGNKLWDKTFGGSDEDWLTIIQQTSDGGFILGGSSESGFSGDKTQASKGAKDYWLIKLDAKGNKIWDKTYGGSSNSNIGLHDLVQTSDGGYLVAGATDSGAGNDKSQVSKGGVDIWIIKIDATGNKLWDKTFGGSSNDGVGFSVIYFGKISLQQTSDGGYILGGCSESGISADKSQSNKGKSDYWILKLDNSGNKLWDKSFGGNDRDFLYAVQQTSDGGYILGGTSESGVSGDKTEPSKGGMDQWVIKLDALGNKQWDKTIGGSDYDWLYSLSQTNSGYILVGDSYSNISGDKTQSAKGKSDGWIVKLDTYGSKIWDASFGGTDYDSFYSLAKTLDGGYILGGDSESGINEDKSQLNHGPDSQMSDYWVLKLGYDPSEKKVLTNCDVNVFPNPSQGKVNLNFCNLFAAEVELIVFDLLGRIVLRKKLKTTDNQLSAELSLPVAKEMYLLQLKAGDQIINRKIVVE